jgi:hypothetical protein
MTPLTTRDTDRTKTAKDPPVRVRGIASDVTLEPSRGAAIKVYRRNRFIEVLYRIAFQTSFPYVNNLAALKAAQYRRRIAGLITKYFLGRDVVAPVIDVARQGNRVAFITEYIEGSEPKDRKRARAFLHEVADAFIRTGLPTWQITPYNPRALGNLIETPSGDYMIIDLESNVVTPMVPLSELWAAAWEAHLPPFDDIDLMRLWTFIERNRDEIENRLGSDGAEDLINATSRYAWYERLWHREEPRLWSRALRGIVRALDVPAHLRAIGHRISGLGKSAARAEGWLEAGIVRWEDKGWITEDQAAAARSDMAETQTLAVLGHLGAHLAMSVPLRFPIGGLARLSWVVFFRLRTELRALIRGRADDETRLGRSTHGIPVMVATVIPGVGSGAYILAAPIRRNRLLLGVAMDQGLHLLPLKLYERLHLNSVTRVIATGGDSKQAPEVEIPELRSDLGRLVSSLKPHAVTISIVLSAALATVFASLGYYMLTGSDDAFDEFGPVSTLKVIESIAAGVVGVMIYRKFWAQPEAEDRPGAATTLFWPLAGLAMAWVAIDDYVQIHEAFVEPLPRVWVLEHANHLFIVGYFVVGVALVALFERQIRSSRPVFLMTAIGLFFVVATFVFDSLVPGDGVVTAIEETSHVGAATALLSAFLIRHRLVAADART